jgi:type II secretory pathway component HofQ
VYDIKAKKRKAARIISNAITGSKPDTTAGSFNDDQNAAAWNITININLPHTPALGDTWQGCPCCKCTESIAGLLNGLQQKNQPSFNHPSNDDLRELDIYIMEGLADHQEGDR